MACFILAYPEITPLKSDFVDWMISDFIPQVVWGKTSIKIVPSKTDKQCKIMNQFLPELSITEHEDKLSLILNKITGVNRLMTLDHRMSKLKLSSSKHKIFNLRVQFVDNF